MIHKLLIFLCALQHDINQKSIIKAKYKAFQIQHFIKNSLLSCHFDIEMLINAFLKQFYLNLNNNHFIVKIVPIVFITN